MAENLIDLRRRIKSVKNTQKITRAMKTVSAAKLRRSVMELNKTKPMMEKIASLLARVSAVSGALAHPLLEERKSGHTLLVAISADKGLCGAFNSHLVTKVEERFKELNDYEGEGNVSLITIGKKVSAHFAKRDFPVKREFRDMMGRLTYQHALDLSVYLQEIYLNPKEEIKQVEFVYTKYISAGKQDRTVSQLFPIKGEWEDKDQEDQPADVEYIFEPDAEVLFRALLPKYINSMVFQVLLQSSASEHAARMIAMELASNNASDMIRSLTLTMNKLRQASITNELLEIITATEALTK
jgi:F-type H+-transporting ATPase subunit gamma